MREGMGPTETQPRPRGGQVGRPAQKVGVSRTYSRPMIVQSRRHGRAFKGRVVIGGDPTEAEVARSEDLSRT